MKIAVYFSLLLIVGLCVANTHKCPNSTLANINLAEYLGKWRLLNLYGYDNRPSLPAIAHYNNECYQANLIYSDGTVQFKTHNPRENTYYDGSLNILPNNNQFKYVINRRQNAYKVPILKIEKGSYFTGALCTDGDESILIGYITAIYENTTLDKEKLNEIYIFIKNLKPNELNLKTSTYNTTCPNLN